MDKFIHIGEKLGLEGEKLLEFVEKQQKLEDERRREEEEKKKNVYNWKRKKKTSVDC